MRAYELMIIADGGLDEADARAWVQQVSEQVRTAGGHVVTDADWWGKRRFAYPIKRQHEGYYAVFNIEAPAGSLATLERNLRIADEIVRHKLIRLPDHEAARRGMVGAGASS